MACIYQIYANIKVYTWYIPGIYRLYDNIGDIGGIYHTKTSMHLFGTSHVPPSTGHIPGIYLLYPGRLHFFSENLGNFPQFGKFPKFFPKFSQIFPNSFWEITPTTA